MKLDYKYEERFIVYLDLLGWSNEIMECPEKGPNQKVKNAIRLIEEISKNKGYPDLFQYAIISDGIAISCLAESDDRIINIGYISNLCRELLAEGFLSRGGLTMGLCYHKGNVIFGPAMVKAAHLEKQAKQPIILCDIALNAIIKKYIYVSGRHWTNGPYFTSYQAMDEQYMVNWFPSTNQDIENEYQWNHKGIQQKIDIIKQIIDDNILKFKKGIDEKDKKCLEKWQYAKKIMEYQLGNELHTKYWKSVKEFNERINLELTFPTTCGQET